MDFLPKDPAILEIRKAERHDVPLLLEFIKGIARYAKMEDEVIASPDVLERDLAKIAREHHCGRMEWMSLDWNKPSNDFYRSLGAIPIDDCTVYRLDIPSFEKWI